MPLLQVGSPDTSTRKRSASEPPRSTPVLTYSHQRKVGYSLGHPGSAGSGLAFFGGWRVRPAAGFGFSAACAVVGATSASTTPKPRQRREAGAEGRIIGTR